MNIKLTSSRFFQILGCGLRQSVYAPLCCATGIIFAASYELELPILLSFRMFWPMLAAVFLSKTLSKGIYCTAEETACTKERQIPLGYAFLSAVPLIAVCFVLLPQRTSDSPFWLLATVLAVYAAINVAIGATFRCCDSFCEGGTSSKSIRYTVVLQMVWNILDTTVGAFVPLAVFGYHLCVPFFLFWLGYLGFWFATRNVKQGKYDRLHNPFFVAVFFLGVAFFFVVYVIAKVDAPELTIPLKGFFVSFYLGLYLAIPEAFVRTWDTQNPNEEDTQKHFALLKAILVIYDPFVYLAFLWLRLSAVFIGCYAIGTAIVSTYVSRKREHTGRCRAVFCAGVLALLLLEFCGVFQTVTLFPTMIMDDGISPFVNIGLLVIAVFPNMLIGLHTEGEDTASDKTKWKSFYHTSLFRERAMALFLLLVLLRHSSSFIESGVRMYQCMSSIGSSLIIELLIRLFDRICHSKDDDIVI